MPGAAPTIVRSTWLSESLTAGLEVLRGAIDPSVAAPSSIIGAFWGGMTIGLVQQMSTIVLPTQLQNAAIFAVFLLIIFFRPQGFFGRMVERT